MNLCYGNKLKRYLEAESRSPDEEDEKNKEKLTLLILKREQVYVDSGETRLETRLTGRVSEACNPLDSEISLATPCGTSHQACY